jgi:uncharacterized FAD-dependent dehydrogenase
LRRLLVSGLRLPPADEGKSLETVVARRLGVEPERVASWRIVRRSLDARGRRPPVLEYSVVVLLRADAEPAAGDPDVKPWRPVRRILHPVRAESGAPVVVGAGPAGLFAALRLTEYGVRPVIVERGRPVEERVRDVARYWREGLLDPESNVLFGEGGAGTYSDGKLTTRIKDFRKEWVLERFVEAGAGADILFDAKPHVGTDRLRTVVANLRRTLLERGAVIHFGRRMEELLLTEDRAAGVVTEAGNIAGPAVFLATGHSARGVYEWLDRRGVRLAAKGFALGLRVEVEQEEVNRRQYGRRHEEAGLPPAEFVLKEQTGDGRGVYSFCMCPGGTVIPAGSEPDGTVVNGMSGSRRSGRFANAALVVEVRPADFGSDPLEGLRFQRKWERIAREAAGPRAVPASTVGTFLLRSGRQPLPRGSCPWEPRPADLAACLPGFAAAGLREALPAMIRKLPPLGGGLLLGVETRTSSPVRIERGEDGQSLSTPGLYPVGEGAGYAGGIMSSAVDGARAVDAWAALHGGRIDEMEEREEP